MIASSRRDRAFADLVHEVSDPLFRTALLLRGDWQHAEDLVQTALTKLYVRGRWARPDHPLGYLRGEHSYAGWREPDREVRVDLFRALATLAAIDRAVVVLRYWDDLTVAETATLVGLSPGAARVRSLRVLARLRQTLTPIHDLDRSGERS